MKRFANLLMLLAVAGPTATAAQAASLSKQLLELEPHVQWKAVDPAWKNRRSAWIKDCKGATAREEALVGV